MIINPAIFNSEVWKALSKHGRSTLLYLCVRADTEGRCFPSIKTIAGDMHNKPQTVIDAVQELIVCGIVSKDQEPGKVARYKIKPMPFRIPVPYEILVSEKVDTSTVQDTTPVPFGTHEQIINIEITDHIGFLGSEGNTPKKTKETKGNVRSGKKPVEIPEHLKCTFDAFRDMRKKIKKPMTDYAEFLILTELEKLSGDSNTQIRILEQSIKSSWQDVYPLKVDLKQSKITPQRATPLLPATRKKIEY